MDNTIKYDEGGQIQRHKPWNELSLSEKSEMIKVAVINGITDLPTIKEKYNEFANGGGIHIAPSKKGTFTAAATKHGMGVQEFASKVLSHPENYSPAMRKKANFARNAAKWRGLGGNLFDDGGEVIDVEGYPLVTSDLEGLTDWFNNNPNVAGMAIGAGLNGIGGERRIVLNPNLKDSNARNSVYMNESYRHFFDANNIALPAVTDVQREAYKGTSYEGLDRRIQETEAARYLSGDPSHHLNTKQKAQLSNFRFTYPGRSLPEVVVEGGDAKELWTMEDEAKYREWRNSLPDNLRLTNDNDYDMRGAFKAGMQPTLESDGLYHLGSRDPETGRILKAPYHPTYLQAINTDARMGYYPMVDDKGQTYTQTWKGNLFADGGIHIKPENRGKFTALKERTGHSATWFKEHGTPAQKKMATFALNARKWKHGFGGPLVEDAMAHYYDGISEDTQHIEVPDNTYVYRSPMFSSITPELSREAALNRTNNVFSNYNEAIDTPLSTTETNIKNAARWVKDNIYEAFPSGVSNCTLTTTQWVDPTKPVNKAASIVNAPSLYNYQTINQEQAIPGDILISRNPNNNTYHTMLVTSFADKPGVYDFDGTPYKFDAGEPLLTYSKGGHDVSFIRRDIPLSVYTPNSDGKIENHFFRYKYPKERFLPEIVITPNR